MQMKRNLIYVLIFFGVINCIVTNAQTTLTGNLLASDTIVVPLVTITAITNSLYFEAGGNALYQSINYEKMICTNGKYKLAFRVGYGFNPTERKDIFFPFELNYYRGKTHNWEVGIGFTPCNTELDNFFKVAQNRRNTQALTSLRLGYRYISKNKHLMLRAGILMQWRSYFDTYGGQYNDEVIQTRTFFQEKRNYYSDATIWDGISENIIPWFGVSVGYNFTKLKVVKK
jgi:hypothetical protein